jgi:hydroxyethylthiazole kinase-like uncharacterized protein yjeF
MPRSHPADAALDRDLLRAWPLPANDADDKRGRGTALIIGGSEQTPGAVLLAGTAALRVGAGKLQLATAGPTATAVAVAMPEALVLPIEQERALAERIERADAVVVGPGLLDPRLAARLLDLTLASAPDDAVIVIDAEAIGHLPKLRRRRRSSFAGDIVITPNREELSGLVADGGRQSPGAQERQAASELNVTVVSFGCVAAPDGRCWLDGSRVRGLGTSGAGDVLAGAVGGLAARCHDGPQAACWAGLVHRVAAHRLATARTPIGYLARELADELSSTLAWLDPAGGAA